MGSGKGSFLEKQQHRCKIGLTGAAVHILLPYHIRLVPDKLSVTTCKRAQLEALSLTPQSSGACNMLSTAF